MAKEWLSCVKKEEEVNGGMKRLVEKGSIMDVSYKMGQRMSKRNTGDVHYGVKGARKRSKRKVNENSEGKEGIQDNLKEKYVLDGA